MERFGVLGVPVTAADLATAAATVERWVAERRREYVCVTGVHGVMECQRDAELRAIHAAAGMVTPDGMPLVWLGRRAGHKGMGRVYGPDLMLELFRRSTAEGPRHFLYGATSGVLDRLAANLRRRFPNAPIVGTHAPPFRDLTPAERDVVAARIDASGADVVWVGLSTPKQERWMAAFRPRLRAPILIGVGAAFDFHAGLKRQAPPFMRRSGLEWLFRLGQEPRRLWRRYLLNNPTFIYLVACEKLKLKNFEPPSTAT